MKFLKTTFSLFATALLLAACGQEKKEDKEVETDMAANTEMTAAAESADMDDSWENDESAMENDPTIVGVASNNDKFSTLVTALGEADLVGTLDGEGPYTVFAPTNEAFEKLPAGTVESLLKDENSAKLTEILTYHVVPGEYNSEAVIQAIEENNNAYPVSTVEGSVITLSLENGNVILTDVAGNKSTVTQPDVTASNGVIHVIDNVVMPNDK